MLGLWLFAGYQVTPKPASPRSATAPQSTRDISRRRKPSYVRMKVLVASVLPRCAARSRCDMSKTDTGRPRAGLRPLDSLLVLYVLFIDAPKPSGSGSPAWRRDQNFDRRPTMSSASDRKPVAGRSAEPAAARHAATRGGNCGVRRRAGAQPGGFVEQQRALPRCSRGAMSGTGRCSASAGHQPRPIGWLSSSTPRGSNGV